MMLREGAAVATALALVLTVNPALAQGTSREAGSGAAKTGAGAPDYFPRAAGDPAAIARGKQIYSANCAFCHGSDARGGEVGPNLLRSPIVLNDQKGEVLAAVVANGRVEKGMPKFNLSLEQIADIAAFVHSINMGRDSAFNEKSILVGNPAAGKAYFNGKGGCSSCHSVTGDLAGIGSRFGPKSLQDRIVTGGSTGMLGAPLPSAPPRTARVSLPSGSVVEGRIVSIDDFAIVITDADGGRRTFPRDGDVPKVEVHDPLQAHADLMKAGRDDDIHNLTAYLATVK
jgi:cytochrome c oxidase cbb3-type subunit III